MKSDKKHLMLFLLIFLVFPNSNYSFEEVKTTISKVIVNGELLSEPLSKDIIIEPSDEIIFYFSKNLKYRSNDGLVFHINFNNGSIKKTISTNYIKFGNLKEGIYTLNVQAYVGESWEIIPLNLKFIVRKKVAQFHQSKNFTLSPLVVYTVLALLLFELIIVLALLFQKKEKVKDIAEYDEYKSLDRTYNVLKISYKELEDANSELKKNIQKLTRTINNLENANVELMNQKEFLQEKKTQLEDLQKQKDDLFAISVHDLKNPASTIKGLIELLDSYDLTASEQQEIMESLVASSETIFQLTQELSSTISKEGPKNKVELVEASLKKVIDTVVSINSAYASKKQVRVINRSSSTLPDFYFDPNKIREVLDNLINNAIKYAPPETEVIIEAFFTDTKVVVEISDNGVGLSEKDQKLAFEKGAKLSSIPTGGEKSSGLGLWIVKTIVEKHGGIVWVKSKLNSGSTFAFELPTNPKLS